MRRTFVVLVVSHSSPYSLQKLQLYIWICQNKAKVGLLSVPFSRTRTRKRHFFNDVTITSSLRSVVQVLIGLFTIFLSHGLSKWFVPNIMKSCLNLSKLRPFSERRNWQSLFSGHGVLHHSPQKPPLNWFYKRLYGGISPRRKHIFTISCQPVKRFCFCDGRISPFPIVKRGRC